MAIRRLHLALVFHNHQPVGNFDWVLDELYAQAYLPMLDCVERHPRVKIALHYTGFLLDYLRERHPDFLKRVRARVQAGQVEVLGGGYFEPILPSIPDRDKHRQLVALREAVEDSFGRRPRGLWLAERVWEPSLAGDLAEAGYEYTVLDDSHFKMVGIAGDRTFGYYQTEDQGRRLNLLITSQALRYSIPWHDVREVMGQLRGMAATEPRLALMGDDGEKFGGWPGTHEKCWERGWMDRFFRALERSSSWLETVLPADYIDQQPARGLIYLPPGSYPEMLEWSGGFWRNFLVRYPEINLAHKKMMRTSAKVELAARNGGGDGAVRDLLRGQSNDAYWHGVFGGVYLPHLRRAVWSSLLEAERAADAALHDNREWERVEVLDHDYDGHHDVLYESSAQNVYVSPALGGALVEWDLKERALNLLDCLQRRPEAYHEKLRGAGVGGQVDNIHEMVRAKEPGLEKRLSYDRLRRLGLQAFLVTERTRPGQLRRSSYRELGDFAAGLFQLQGDPGRNVVLARESRLSGGRSPGRVRMTKRLRLEAGRACIDSGVELELVSGPRLRAKLLVVMNAAIFAGVDDCTLELLGGGEGRRIDTEATMRATAGVRLRQRPLDISMTMRLEPAAAVWYYPVETINNSESGYERVLQGGCFTAVFPVNLSAGESCRVKVILEAS
jgi:alpha-amylase